MGENVLFLVLRFLFVREQFSSFIFYLWPFRLVLIINRGPAQKKNSNEK